jgi:hypothetical protein
MASRAVDSSRKATPRRNGEKSNGSLSDMKAVILAGGRGTGLAPYTSVLPKPLMPIGERSILEIVVEQLEHAGVVNIDFCVGYLSHLIQAVFESRQNGHVNITYVREPDALGTAAPLRLVEDLDRTFLVMNGDVLTTLDCQDLVSYHREQGNLLTIAARERSITVDYGILHIYVAQRVRDFEEKPQIVTPGEHGHLRHGAGGARAHPRGPALRLPRPRRGTARGGAPGEAEATGPERLQLRGSTPGHLLGVVGGDRLLPFAHLGRPPVANPLEQTGEGRVGGGVAAKHEARAVPAWLQLAALAGPVFSLGQRLADPFRARGARTPPSAGAPSGPP